MTGGLVRAAVHHSGSAARLRRAVVAALAVLGLLTEAAPAAEPPFALISPDTVSRLALKRDTKEGKTEIRFADRALDREPKPMERIHVEGTLPHQGIYDESNEAKRDWPIALDFALAYRLSGDDRYRIRAERYLIGWIDRYRVSFNPIDETELDHLILVHDLIKGAIAADGEASMLQFLRTMAQGYIARIKEQKRIDTGNWQSHRIKLLTLAAYALGDPGLIDEARTLYRAHVARNVDADGAVWDFYQRDALHYVTYDLEPLSLAALAAKAHGEDWYAFEAPNGGSLEKALAWLVPYAEGRLTHEEFVRSQVKFDYTRRDAGVAGFAGTWEPKGAAYLYGLATRLDRGYASIIAKIGGWQRPWLALSLD